jgi:hypothetical protein
MPGHNEERGTARLPITEAFSRSDTNTSGFNSQKDHPTKLLLIKNKLSDGAIPY